MLLQFQVKREPNLIRIKGDTSIVGDIHGQFYDLIYIYNKIKKPPQSHTLFLGDYVDRGIYSVEVLAFLEECLKKYDQEIYDLFNEAFDWMPVAALVNNDYFCMHGGISPHLNDIDEIDDLDRAIEPPIEGILCDLLWSDPIDDIIANQFEFKENKERECSWYFGNQPVKDLLRDKGLVSVVRAHQVQQEGYKMHRWNGMSNFPSVITVFSAPNYCGSYKNQGAILVVKNGKMQIKQFQASEQPFHLPGDIDLINWSLPFLAEKVASMLFYIVSQNKSYTPNGEKDLENIDFSKLLLSGNSKFEREEILRTKVKSVARIARMYKTIKENNELLIEIKEMSFDGKIPRGLLMEGKSALKDAFKEYMLASVLDQQNEKRPSRIGNEASNKSSQSQANATFDQQDLNNRDSDDSLLI
eukprot:403375095